MFNLQEKLEAYISSCTQEEEYRRVMLMFMANYPNCFDRSLVVGHFTGSAWLLNKDRSHALLMHHTKLNRWLQLGGHCDGNANVLEVAIREAQEESGIGSIVSLSQDLFDIDIHLIPERGNEKAHYHYDVRFLLGVTSDEQIVQNRESKELRWIPRDKKELPTDNPSILRMFHKWVTREF